MMHDKKLVRFAIGGRSKKTSRFLLNFGFLLNSLHSLYVYVYRLPILPESYQQFSGSRQNLRISAAQNTTKNNSFITKSVHYKVPFYYPNVELKAPFRIQKVENKRKKYNQEIRSQSENAMYSFSTVGQEQIKLKVHTDGIVLNIPKITKQYDFKIIFTSFDHLFFLLVTNYQHIHFIPHFLQSACHSSSLLV